MNLYRTELLPISELGFGMGVSTAIVVGVVLLLRFGNNANHFFLQGGKAFYWTVASKGVG